MMLNGQSDAIDLPPATTLHRVHRCFVLSARVDINHLKSTSVTTGVAAKPQKLDSPDRGGRPGNLHAVELPLLKAADKPAELFVCAPCPNKFSSSA
jgi:hypothetical protein